MKAKTGRRLIHLTDNDGVVQAIHDIQDRGAFRDYVDRYIKLRAKVIQLQKKGLKVKIVLPDLPRRPMLVIGK
jgi:hypothetical protein